MYNVVLELYFSIIVVIKKWYELCVPAALDLTWPEAVNKVPGALFHTFGKKISGNIEITANIQNTER